METEIKEIDERLMKLARDVEIIKGLLMLKVDEEGELSNWAKKELMIAREEDESQRVSLEDLKKEIEDEL
ncbi:MAG: hypothetical protein AABW67_05190 [Nanoarchaeota archaeon]